MTWSQTSRTIEREVDILRANQEFALKMQKHQGMCWCPAMEKEAELQLNPNTVIRLKHPVLVARVATMESTLRERLSSATEKCGRITFPKQVIDDFRAWYSTRPMLSMYDLQDEYDHFVRMQVELQARDGVASDFGKRAFATWLAHRYVLAETSIADIPCTCRGTDEVSLHQILPVGSNHPEVICYNSCDRTLFAAFKRQMMRVYEPDPQIAQQFKHFVEGYFKKYVEPVLAQFDYSYSQWFNKLPRKKQIDMERVADMSTTHIYPQKVEYGLFCKREKQEAGGKNRAIANITPEIKYMMGPVCWALEDCADKFFPGYCGKKSWDDLEHLFETYYAEGFKYVLQGDGSAFDTCQHVELKVIDQLIYTYLADHGKIHHVDGQAFKRVATANLRELKAKTLTKYGCRHLGSATIRGTVFSGASDTTLMNTLRMALYNMFTLEKLGLRLNQDYKLLSKGDDFIVFVREPTLNGVDFESCYLKYWKPKPKKHTETNFRDNKGTLGMILKFLNTGDYDTIDFCSVTCIPYGDHTKFKLARKPNRMIPLASYSRATLRMTPGQVKQYLLDQAFALDISHGNMPFYRDYAAAYRHMASRITAKPQRFKTGHDRVQIPDDGHKHVELSQTEDFAMQEFYDYGHEYVQGYISRMSTHSDAITDAEVTDHLAKHFGITLNDIEYHRRFLLGAEVLYGIELN